MDSKMLLVHELLNKEPNLINIREILHIHPRSDGGSIVEFRVSSATGQLHSICISESVQELSKRFQNSCRLI